MRARRIVLAALTVTLLTAWVCAAAQATSTTWHQNPDLVVTAKLTPTKAHIGDVVYGVATVTNVSDGKLRVNFEADFETPSSGEAAGTGGRLEPGHTVKLKFQRLVTGKELGRFTLSVHASSKNGRSTASVQATSTP